MRSTPGLPKYLDIAQLIESRLGQLNGHGAKLPTVRGIADEFGVSIVTASRALQVLRDKGLVHTVERSGCFLVSPAAAEVECYALVQNVTQHSYRQATLAIMERSFEALMSELSFRLAPESLNPFTNSVDAHFDSFIQHARQSKVRGLFLLPSRVSDESAARDERLMQACQRANLPVVLIERNLRGDLRPLRADLLANDDFEGGQLLTHHLHQQGKRRIAFVTGSPISTHNQRLAGYLFACYRLGIDPVCVLEEPGEVPSRQAYREIAARLLDQRVDGVVCYQDYTAIGLIVELMSRRILVPDEVALAGFDNLPIGDSFAIGVTTYSFPATAVAREAIQQMRWRLQHLDAPPRKIVIAGEVIIRESSQRANS